MMSAPETANTTRLWCESATSHGAADKNDATVAPSPSSTRSDGSAQHNSVPTEVNSEAKLHHVGSWRGPTSCDPTGLVLTIFLAPHFDFFHFDQRGRGAFGGLGHAAGHDH